MRPALRPRVFVLFIGDIFFFLFSLWLSLMVRLSFSVGHLALPSQALFGEHLVPFSLLSVVWVGVFFIAGLYEARAVALGRRSLSGTLLTAQIVNVTIAALFFFFIAVFGIEPKTLLFIYLAVSFLFILFWRAILFPLFGLARGERMIVVGEGIDVDELVHALEVRGARSVPQLRPGETPALAERVAALALTEETRFIVADWHDARVAAAFPALYNLLARGIRFLDTSALYEEVFGRVSLDTLDERWLARSTSRAMHLLYDPLKRVADIVLAIVGGIISLIFYPFIIFAIKMDDHGPIFVRLDRVGKNGAVFPLLKFRSMTGNDNAAYGKSGTTTLRVTRVGHFLRKSRLDELPQFWNLLRGEVSSVGPRPESPALVALYEKEIPYYGVRHFIKPGLTGWAQLYHDNHPHHGAAVAATREKLSYDLYYLEHRSLMLDVVITLKTIKKLLMRSGA